MDKIDFDRACPKCGQSTVQEQHQVFYCYMSEHRDDPEHFHRSCWRCGYEWREAPLDAQEAKA